MEAGFKVLLVCTLLVMGAMVACARMPSEPTDATTAIETPAGNSMPTITLEDLRAKLECPDCALLMPRWDFDDRYIRPFVNDPDPSVHSGVDYIVAGCGTHTDSTLFFAPITHPDSIESSVSPEMIFLVLGARNLTENDCAAYRAQYAGEELVRLTSYLVTNQGTLFKFQSSASYPLNRTEFYDLYNSQP